MRFLYSILVLLSTFGAAFAQAPAGTLKAGTAKVNITPEKPRYPVHDSLYARTLVLEAGDVRIAFNRLIVRDNGRAMESWEGDDHYLPVNTDRLVHGPIDSSVGVIKFEDLSGQPRARRNMNSSTGWAACCPSRR